MMVAAAVGDDAVARRERLDLRAPRPVVPLAAMEQDQRLAAALLDVVQLDIANEHSGGLVTLRECRAW